MGTPRRIPARTDTPRRRKEPRAGSAGRIARVDGELRVLTSRHLQPLLALTQRDPVAHCFVADKLADPMDAWSLGGQAWGWFEHGVLCSAMFTGANLIPIETTPRARAAFASEARRRGRRCSSIVGPADEVLDLWRMLKPVWGPPRDVRPTQHLMAVTGPPSHPAHPGLRPLTLDELGLLVPAAIAMFTQEVGVSPVAQGAGPAYRARLADLIRAGRALAIVEEGRIVFKSEIGAATAQVCQVQGVWVAPELRGRGLGGSGMAAVVRHAQAHIAPTVSLYVNDYNHAAIATYEQVGFRTVGTFATILF